MHMTQNTFLLRNAFSCDQLISDLKYTTAMAETLSLLKEDFTCPICYEVFKAPVVVKCSHSFCKECFQQYWSTQELLLCPFCRKQCSQDEPTQSLAFTSLCENFKRRRIASATEDICPEHSEKLKLFCFEDKQAICVVCYTSKKHESHKCSPIVEAAQELKVNLKMKIKNLSITLDRMSKVRDGYKEQAEQFMEESQSVEKQFQAEFEKLHQFLREEEESRIAALRKRENKKLEKQHARIDELSKDIAALSGTIAFTRKEIEADNIAFLKKYSENLMRFESFPKVEVDLETSDSEELLKKDEINPMQTLLFTVWARMQNLVTNAPVTLDPNTASSKLVVSEDLTSMSFVCQKQDVPDNPERMYVGVLGSQGFSSGLHCWDVEVGDSDRWTIGVVKQSVNRKKLLKMDPSSGMWSIRLVNGKYRVGAKSRKELCVPEKPRLIRVQLDYEKGEIRFYDPFTHFTLHTFTDINFTETVFPYFCTGETEQAIFLYPANPAHVNK